MTSNPGAQVSGHNILGASLTGSGGTIGWLPFGLASTRAPAPRPSNPATPDPKPHRLTLEPARNHGSENRYQVFGGSIGQFTRNVLLLSLAFALPIAIALRPAIYNPDLWCHLRTGDWILQHHRLPETDPFAQGGEQRTFLAYSWLFEVAASDAYAHIGLRVSPVGTAALSAGIMIALFLLFRSFRISVPTTALMLLLAVLPIRTLFYLRSWLFSILFFVLELWLLLRPRANPKTALIILPIVFVVWTNVHVQFLYGLWVLGLFLGEALWVEITGLGELTASPRWTIRNRAVLLVLCAAATLLNPYGYRIYEVVREYATQGGVLTYVRELRPFAADGWLTIVGLLIPAAAIWSVGYRRERRPFLLVLLAWALATGFHMSRDSWVLVIVSVFTIVATNAGFGEPPDRFPRIGALAVALAVLVVIGGLWRVRHIDNRHLQASVLRNSPAGAADYIAGHHLSGPLFNAYSWGGYLMWRLPWLPVSIDGRTNLYGPARVARQHDTINAAPGWNKDPSLRGAHLILIAPDEPLTAVLQEHPCYRVAYKDDHSVLFTAKENCAW